MHKSVKTLVVSCQDTLTKYLDVLSDVGCVPYSLLKPSLMFATPQQLLKIEKANPDIAKESDELWLRHCLFFKDIREEYEKGMHQNPKKWRQIYLTREQENERKRQLVKEKVKSQYSKILNERQKKSIKVLHNVVQTRGNRSYEPARSKLFQQTRKETQKLVDIYRRPRIIHAPVRSFKNSSNTPLTQAYESYQSKYPPRNSPPRQPSPPLIAPASQFPPPAKRLKVDEKKRKPAAVVNFNIFNELS